MVHRSEITNVRTPLKSAKNEEKTLGKGEARDNHRV